MTISQVEVAGANFRTDEQSDALNTKFMRYLGMRKRYLPARLAIARSLAISTPPEPLTDDHVLGKVIKGDALFGTGTALSVWMALIMERVGETDVDTRELIAFVGAHWRRGLGLLDKEWKHSNDDTTQFVKRLMDAADLSSSARKSPRSKVSEPDISSVFGDGGVQQVTIPIGEIASDVSTGEEVRWDLNGKGGSPHSAIMGGVGSGKTRTAVAMLRAISEQVPVPFLAFDFKGDLGTDASGAGYHVEKLFDAQTLEPPRQSIPLDVLALRARDEVGITQAAERFLESFDRLKGSRLGEKQREAVYDAARSALEKESPCELRHILDVLERVYEEREMKKDGATATMKKICRFPLFEPRLVPAAFFQQSWLVRLPHNVPEDSCTIVVNLILDALDQHLNSLKDTEVDANGARDLRILCMVDEAHRILGSKPPRSLSNLIRMSRSKGGSVMLISQSPNDFSRADDDFLSNMGLVTAFSTNASTRNIERILGKGVKLTALQTGQCFAKMIGEQTARKIQAWE